MAAPDALAAPTLLTGSVSGSTVTLKWAKSEAATSYVVQRGIPGGSLTDRVPTSELSATDAGLDEGEYIYAVIAVAGDKRSSPSGATSITVLPQPVPLPFTAAAFIVAILIAVPFVIAVVWPFPSGASGATIDQINGQVGGYLVGFGVILLTLSFVVVMASFFLAHFRVVSVRPAAGKEGVVAADASGGLVDLAGAMLKAIPDLLRQPAGYGVVAMLLGVLLLLGTAIGYGSPSTTSAASPSPGPSASAVTTPQASPSK